MLADGETRTEDLCGERWPEVRRALATLQTAEKTGGRVLATRAEITSGFRRLLRDRLAGLLAGFSRLPVCHQLELVGREGLAHLSRLQPDFCSRL